MQLDQPKPTAFYQFLLILLAGLSIGSMSITYYTTQTVNWTSFPLIISVFFVVLGGIFFLFKAKINEFFNQLSRSIKIRPFFAAGLFAGLVFLYAGVVLFPNFSVFLPIILKLILLVFFAGLASFILNLGFINSGYFKGFLIYILTTLIFVRLIVYYPSISSSPLSMGWSEGGHFYYASLFFSKMIYGRSLPLPVLNPAMSLLQSIPFLFSIKSILIHRIWVVLLWILLPLWAAILITNRWFKTQQISFFFLAVWLFLFFSWVSVYFHLFLCVIIVLLGFDRKRFWKTMAVVFLASLWAGLCRVNWFPVPGSLAAVLYFLETETPPIKMFDYFKYPLVWFMGGGLTAVFANLIYIRLSGNPPESFLSSYTSYLVWHRLIPNETYRPGILLGLFFTVLPFLLVLFLVLIQRGVKNYWQPYRVIPLLLFLIVFAFGGIVVSLKVGGGADLHNLDAFFVFLLIIEGYIIFDRYPMPMGPKTPVRIHWLPLLLVFFLPLGNVLKMAVPFSPRDGSAEMTIVKSLDETIKQAASSGGEVLLISERQLLTFGDDNEIRFSNEYEKIPLMEWAMAKDRTYLENFYQDLENQKFSLIITDSIYDQKQSQKDAFWIENNMWIDYVLGPILTYYQPTQSFHQGNINVLLPKNKP